MKRAEFSADRRYRYTLWRTGLQDERELFVTASNTMNRDGRAKQFVQFIGLNPSTADETNDDPTLRKCMKFAQRWGYGALCMTNLFAFRATEPTVMKGESDPVGPDNDQWLSEIAGKAGMILVAWGKDGDHMQRDLEVLHELLKGHKLHCLKLNDDGSPQHPLYISSTQEPIEYCPQISQMPSLLCEARSAGQRRAAPIQETNLCKLGTGESADKNSVEKPAHSHRLEVDPPVGSTAMASKSVNHQWRCKCGYTLGDGRAKLLLPCPFANSKIRTL